MTDPRTLSIKDYTYTLPEDRIAKYPLSKRDDSKLLVYNNGEISQDTYRNLPSLLPGKSLLVFNDTRVVEARILFKKPTGGVIEIFCLEPGDEFPGISTAMQQKGKLSWKCLVGGASKWKPGQVLQKKIENTGTILEARYKAKARDAFIIELSWTPGELSFSEILHQTGAIPLPPYIKREADPSDAERYQTVYATEGGSVAAPTAGLHFTTELLADLEKKDIKKEFVTLHVSAGTFKPVKTERIGDHEMHAEWIDVKKQTIQQLISHIGGNITAVGTTSMRTLESLYWIGVKLLAYPGADRPEPVGQWEPYENKNDIPVERSLQAIIEWMNKKNKKTLVTQTSILIAPGYQFRIVNGLITNFHQPQSTLLLLIAAFIGADWKKVYDYALDSDFRFLSYGDGCLLMV